MRTITSAIVGLVAIVAALLVIASPGTDAAGRAYPYPYPLGGVYLPLLFRGEMPPATPTATPTATPWAATATPTRTATATPTAVPPTATRTATPVTCNGYAQALQNPSFADGLNHWLWSGYPAWYTGGGYGDSYSVWMGGYSNANDIIGQSAVVPYWAETAAIYFEAWTTSSEPTNYPYDKLWEGIYDQYMNPITVGYISNGVNRGTWTLWRLGGPSGGALDIRAYRGQSVAVYFQALTDSSYSTSWFVDDIHLFFACGSYVAEVPTTPVYSLGAGEQAPALQRPMNTGPAAPAATPPVREAIQAPKGAAD